MSSENNSQAGPGSDSAASSTRGTTTWPLEVVEGSRLQRTSNGIFTDPSHFLWGNPTPYGHQSQSSPLLIWPGPSFNHDSQSQSHDRHPVNNIIPADHQQHHAGSGSASSSTRGTTTWPREVVEGSPLQRMSNGIFTDPSHYGGHFPWGNPTPYGHHSQNSPPLIGPLIWPGPSFNHGDQSQPHRHLVNNAIPAQHQQHHVGFAPPREPSVLDRRNGILEESPDWSSLRIGPGSLNIGGLNIGGSRNALRLGPGSLNSRACLSVGGSSGTHAIHIAGGHLEIHIAGGHLEINIAGGHGFTNMAAGMESSGGLEHGTASPFPGVIPPQHGPQMFPNGSLPGSMSTSTNSLNERGSPSRRGQTGGHGFTKMAAGMESSRGLEHGTASPFPGVIQAPQHGPHMFPNGSLPGSMSTSTNSLNERGSPSRRGQTSVARADNNQTQAYKLDLDRISRGEDSRTTLMIQNIPRKYMPERLLEVIDEHHRGTYDFFCLPNVTASELNRGYALINMTAPSQVVPFYLAFNGKKWQSRTTKAASLVYGRTQGKAALLAHFQHSIESLNRDNLPIVFHSEGSHVGDREPFPAEDVNVRTRAS